MSFDLSSFYLERKWYLDELKKMREKNSSPLFQRTLDILIMEAEELLKSEKKDIETKFNIFNQFFYIVDDDEEKFQERFGKFIEEMEKEMNK